jgi:hypothetical protein
MLTVNTVNTAGKSWTHASQHERSVGAFHPGLRQYRSAAWIKVPILWNISKYGLSGKKYNRMLYLSMTTVMNPERFDRSISESYSLWAKAGNKTVSRGAPIKQASVLFFSNYPYFPRPYTNSLLINNHLNSSRGYGSELFAHLWNANFSHWNFAPYFDRSVLLKSIDAKDKVIRTTSYIHSEKQFPPCETNWICSMPHVYTNRTSAFTSMFAWATERLRLPQSDLSVVLNAVRDHHQVEFDMITTVQSLWRQRSRIWSVTGNVSTASDRSA